MSHSPQSLLDRWFHTDEERNGALDLSYDAQIAQSLIRARHSRELTQEVLAKKLGVSQSYVAQLENATVLPSHKKLKTIARILRAALVPPRILVEEEPVLTRVVPPDAFSGNQNSTYQTTRISILSDRSSSKAGDSSASLGFLATFSPV